MKEMTLYAPAKINLTLDVLGRREDGYHDLVMVMQTVSLTDRVTLTTGGTGGVTLVSNRSFLPVDGNNLAVSAAQAFGRAAGVALDGLSICLEKKIPVCAGTAGGSSDAAAVLRGLNALYGTGFSVEELGGIGRQVGADVPYCVMGGTALAEGTGERLNPLTPLPDCPIVLCKPPFSVATPELFARVDGVKLRCRPDTAGVQAALAEGDLAGVARRMYNVFEDVLPAGRQSEVQAIKSILVHCGALGACMSGTGPTVFGLFPGEEEAKLAYRTLRGQYADTYLVRPARGSRAV